mmetsp:Transcript_10010/g.13223  ORF Transcript_10010/g.13223 Transcript_10010/m.13223 type:complete len:114 (+) Transcript_10010:106-447(+)|eukprot:CAMPEP_0198143154 /NCGR_PEP_ID=MMETSP1443-20131203/5913_1 /TAXON_ID=186043 /ORGANISM="Entomoneis sp., Strain CCMP2396" /LENGTH=113 /DNA_ID=CAMNT_0043806323 /DNA_START=46 /DNA_END=387 /DNA_ORIENTATION=-
MAKEAGGIKGFFQRTGKVVHSAGMACVQFGSTGALWAYKWGGSTAFVVATSSVLVFMPLLFEIGREGEMLETEKLQANDMKSKGYSDRQLKDMGFSDLVLHTPSVASLGASGK